MRVIIKEVYDAFISAGVSDEQATAAAAALAIQPRGELATKSDVRELRALLKSDIKELRGEVKRELAALRADTRSDRKDL